MILFPNAKINIGLNILKKRMDGYHEISSIFYPLHKTVDILEIVESKEFSFSKTGILLSDELNICEKAYILLKENHDLPPVKILLHKQIPVGSGLGGGSSDAAFTLKGLNELFKLNLSKEELESYALKLGADCPFFIDNTPKYVEGIGEKMRSINLDLSSYKFVLKNPQIQISTSDAYSKIKPKISLKNLPNLISLPINQWKSKIKNDFEESIFKRNPILAVLKKQLYKDGAIYASMSGSGSMIYGIFKKKG